ncbi:hypothetical protein O4J56_10520 [Nocardiopsis sp. RSe5-2]|uniref:DUF4279 domain-containing protein n=1 Tax=Nocardiopsis endophytica TaxID=3018445 RepID=A0ABT4U3Q4_9ACTN|nr:hypothetical protein [Nocardiopsis endophytica]MDA2811070.1 hypothetical protein [Nocardiopsis endophytica]
MFALALVLEKELSPEGAARLRGLALERTGVEPVERPVRVGTLWKLPLGEDPRPDPLFQRLLRLGDDGARLVADLASGDTVLSLVQEIDDPDDGMQKGIHLPWEVAAWAAAAGASVDIDQYIDVEPE